MKTDMNLRRIVSALLVGGFLCTLGGGTARGDLPRPPKPTTQNVPSPVGNDPSQLVIRIDGDGKTAHLSIPRGILNGLSAQPHADARWSPASTVVAGFAMTAGLVCGGLLLARGRGRRESMVLASALILGVGIFAAIASGNLAPLPRENIFTSQPPPSDLLPLDEAHVPVIAPGNSASHETTIRVVVSVSDDGPIRLTIPVEDAPRLVSVQDPTTRPAPVLNPSVFGK